MIKGNVVITKMYVLVEGMYVTKQANNTTLLLHIRRCEMNFLDDFFP